MLEGGGAGLAGKGCMSVDSGDGEKRLTVPAINVSITKRDPAAVPMRRLGLAVIQAIRPGQESRSFDGSTPEV